MNSFKHRLRSGLDRLAAATGLLQWHEQRMRHGLTILMYHRVLPWPQCIAYPLPSLVLPIATFRQQMKWLALHCQVLPVREALACLSRDLAFTKPLVAVTFDDGYNDNANIVAPILEEFGLRGTFFVTTRFVAEGEPQWYDRAAVAWQFLKEEKRELLLENLSWATGTQKMKSNRNPGLPAWIEGIKRVTPTERLVLVKKAESLVGRPLDLSLFQPINPEQVRDLHIRGHEIASHTVSHPILPQLSNEDLTKELENSAAQLKTWTNAPVVGFCYPNGDYDARVENAVIQSSYIYACTTEEGFNRRVLRPTRLTRLPITMQRTMQGQDHDQLGFRAELCRLRSLWRR